MLPVMTLSLRLPCQKTLPAMTLSLRLPCQKMLPVMTLVCLPVPSLSTPWGHPVMALM
jgi:hypothetical protein